MAINGKFLSLFAKIVPLITKKIPQVIFFGAENF
jgi:hypothetical protein